LPPLLSGPISGVDGISGGYAEAGGLVAVGMDPNVFFFPDADTGQDVLIVMPGDTEIHDNVKGLGVVFLDVGFEGDVQPLGIDQEIEPDLEIGGDHLTGYWLRKKSYQSRCQSAGDRKN
jgi:hypothetical protein